MNSQLFNGMLNCMLFIGEKVYNLGHGILSCVYMQICIRDSQKQPLEEVWKKVLL